MPSSMLFGWFQANSRHGFQTYEQLSRDLDSLRGLRGLRRGLRAPLHQKKSGNWQDCIYLLSGYFTDHL